MRAALFTETFLPRFDGVVTRLRHTLRELSRMGDEVLVIAPRYPEGGPDHFAGALVHRVPSVSFPPYPAFRLGLVNPGVGRALRSFRPELIHAVHPFVLGVGAPYYARRLGVPLLASYHAHVATYTRFYGFSSLHRATRWYTRTLLNRAEINLCTSQATMNYLRAEGIKQVHLWPQGVDAESFTPVKASQEWRERLSAGQPSEKLLLFVGRAPESSVAEGSGHTPGDSR